MKNDLIKTLSLRTVVDLKEALFPTFDEINYPPVDDDTKRIQIPVREGDNLKVISGDLTPIGFENEINFKSMMPNFCFESDDLKIKNFPGMPGYYLSGLPFVYEEGTTHFSQAGLTWYFVSTSQLVNDTTYLVYSEIDFQGITTNRRGYFCRAKKQNVSVGTEFLTDVTILGKNSQPWAISLSEVTNIHGVDYPIGTYLLKLDRSSGAPLKTAEVTKINILPLNPIYIPNCVPDFNSSDEGKVLKIVDGKMAWVSEAPPSTD